MIWDEGRIWSAFLPYLEAEQAQPRAADRLQGDSQRRMSASPLLQMLSFYWDGSVPGAFGGAACHRATWVLELWSLLQKLKNQLGRKKSPLCGKISEWVRIVLLLRTRCMLMVLSFLYSAGTNKILYVLIVILFFVALIGIVIFIVYYKNKGKKLTGTW